MREDIWNIIRRSQPAFADDDEAMGGGADYDDYALRDDEEYTEDFNEDDFDGEDEYDAYDDEGDFDGDDFDDYDEDGDFDDEDDVPYDDPAFDGGDDDGVPYDEEDGYAPEDYEDAGEDGDDFDEAYDDYGDGYDDEEYDDYEGAEDGEDDGTPRSPSGAPLPPFLLAVADALDYINHNDWVLWALLVLLPPLGIYLVWKNRRFQKRGRIFLSVVSGLWLIALIVLIFNPFAPRSDTVFRQASGNAPAEEEAAEEESAPTANPAVLLTDEEVEDANAVYATQDDPFYHKQSDCRALAADQVAVRISENTAIDKSLMPCPYCMASQYEGAFENLAFLKEDTEDASGVQVYCSAYNVYYHTDPVCSGLNNPKQVGLKEALLMNRTACPTCCPGAAKQVYCTENGTYYHVKHRCSGMANASQITYAEARVIGKQRCPVCIGGSDDAETADLDKAAETANSRYVYATQNGSYYHIDEHCSGMLNAVRVSLAEMLSRGRRACPVCCPGAERTVYTQSGNPYYHSYANCSSMTNAQSGTLAAALASGYEQCPVCWTRSTVQ